MPFKRKMLINAAGIAAAVLATAFLPLMLCSRGASEWMRGDLARQSAFAEGVKRMVIDDPVSRSDFKTGSSQFNGEWAFGTYQMAGIGFAQMAIEHPELRERHSALTKQCIERMLSPEIRAFDKETWGEDPIEGIDGPNHHAAYLGYFNFVLSLHRLASGDNTYAGLNDRITAALIRHLSASSIGLLHSYPGEVYPVDNCFVIGSIGLHQQVTGQDHSEIIGKWSATARSRYIDRETGLLIQAVSPADGTAADEPRGSGTALGLIPLHYADRQMALDLYNGIKKSLSRRWLGFGVIREYPEEYAGQPDIDSGPVVFGYGLSATGFTIAGARRYGDYDMFRRITATANLFGAPSDRDGRHEYASGGPLGNAILFAMFTTPELPKPAGGGQK